MEKLLKKLAICYMRWEEYIRRHKKLLFAVSAVFLIIVIIAMWWINSRATNTGIGRLIVVIDPGHGENDPGKVGVSGAKEKEINLEISCRLKECLEERGIEVIMTREDDNCLATPGARNKKSSDMSNRVELINSSGAVCFVSIHQNSYPDSAVKGAQVFYHGGSKESRLLAEKIQSQMIDNVDSENHRMPKEGNDLYILRKTAIPGVIVECGFLSCPQEEAKLCDEEYQKKIANAIATAIEQIY